MHASQQLSQFSGAAKGQQTEQLQREVRAQQVPNNGSSGLARQGTTGGVSTWTLMLRIWPLEDRPEEMLVPDVVNGLTFDQLMGVLAKRVPGPYADPHCRSGRIRICSGLSIYLFPF